MSRIVFTEGNHRYALDGKYVPSVTTVKNALAKPALVNWAARMAAEWAVTHHGELQMMGAQEWQDQATRASSRGRDKGRDTGKLLHRLAESLVYGEPLPDHDQDGLPFPDEIRRCAQQLARFYDAWEVAPVIHEAIVFHEDHKWAGTLDLIADLRDEGGGPRWLIDYKTGATGIWPETALQLAAYRHATHIVSDGKDLPMPKVDHAGAVWLRPDGWELVPVVADLQMYGIFQHLHPVALWMGQRRDQSVLAPLPVPEVQSA